MHDLEDGQRWVQLFLKHCPSYFPDTWGFFEPYRTPFNASGVPSNFVKGQAGFQQRGRISLGFFFIPSGYNLVHSSFTFIVKPKYFNWNEIFQFIEICILPMQIDYVDLDLEHDPFSTTHELRKSLPRVTWFTYFGKPYMEMAANEIAAVQIEGGRVWSLGEGVAMQLTSDPMDLRSNPKKIETVTENVRQQLFDFYRLPNDPESVKASYRAPIFNLQPFEGMKIR